MAWAIGGFVVSGGFANNTDEDLLTRLVGVEDAPEQVIKSNQNRVRSVAVESGRHGLLRVPATP